MSNASKWIIAILITIAISIWPTIWFCETITDICNGGPVTPWRVFFILLGIRVFLTPSIKIKGDK